MFGPGDHPLPLVAVAHRTDRAQDAQDCVQRVLQCQDQVRHGHVWYCGQRTCQWTRSREGHPPATARGSGPVDRQPIWIPTGNENFYIRVSLIINLCLGCWWRVPAHVDPSVSAISRKSTLCSSLCGAASGRSPCLCGGHQVSSKTWSQDWGDRGDQRRLDTQDWHQLQRKYRDCDGFQEGC